LSPAELAYFDSKGEMMAGLAMPPPTRRQRRQRRKPKRQRQEYSILAERSFNDAPPA
jgi:hypothetical protein